MRAALNNQGKISCCRDQLLKKTVTKMNFSSSYVWLSITSENVLKGFKFIITNQYFNLKYIVEEYVKINWHLLY